jgi:hypothetical protein
MCECHGPSYLNRKRKNGSFLKSSEICCCTVNVKSHVSQEGVWWSGAIDPSINNFGSRWRWVINFTPRLFTAWKRHPVFTTYETGTAFIPDPV